MEIFSIYAYASFDSGHTIMRQFTEAGDCTCFLREGGLRSLSPCVWRQSPVCVLMSPEE